MVQLFLSKPNWEADNGKSDSAKLIISHLNQLESLLWSLVISSGRSEARLWLCSTLSSINSLSPEQQREIFVSLLMSKQQSRNHDLAAQLLQMLFQKSPRKTGTVLADKSYKLEKFFEGNPRRIMQWFSNFSDGSGLGHQKGAKALSKFAFVNRDICWEELEWRGKHGQSPAMVATKPHYFLDLDVQRTVENFLDNVPEFWSSNEFAETLKDGEILFIDNKFFVDFFVDLMYEENARDVWEVVNEFLTEESFSCLCHQLLIILEERELCSFLKLLCKYISASLEPKDFSSSSSWLEIILFRCRDFESIDQLLFLNAIINQRRLLLGFVHDDEYQEERAKIKDIISQISTTSLEVNNLTSMLKECLKLDTVEAIKLMGLHSWVIFYKLSEECRTPEFWEAVFVSNGIRFRKSDKYALLHYDGLSEESGSDLDESSSTRSKRKKKKKSKKKRRRNYDNDDIFDNQLLDFDTSRSGLKKKRRRNYDNDDIFDNQLLDFDTSRSGLSLQSRAVSWLLSTDGFSTTWTSADLPYHLSKHCLSTWIKCLADKWTSEARFS